MSSSKLLTRGSGVVTCINIYAIVYTVVTYKVKFYVFY